MIHLDKIYLSETVTKSYAFRYDKKNTKRPSWILFEELPKNVQFIKILKENEPFWYRRYFESYFFPLLNEPVDYKNYYDEISQRYDLMVPQNELIGNFLLSSFKKYKIPQKTLCLDIGAGTGIISEILANGGYKSLELLDISKKCLSFAKKRESLKNCKFLHANILEYNEKQKYSLIFSSMALDYFTSDQRKKIAFVIEKHLQKGGYFFYVDRHIYPEFTTHLHLIEQKSFELQTKEGAFKYFLYIGKKK
ncbi:MAG: class I SAM-dependent methyltransferase [bacterium]|nr:class I SAM-dependent methyltransferase [bacterium]